MNRASLIVAWAVAFALSAGLVGCGDESNQQPPQGGTEAEAAHAKIDQAQIRDLEAKLQAAAGEAAKSAEQIGKLVKERDGALAKAKEAEASVGDLQWQLREERKLTAELDGKLKNLRATLAALRQRLWASGQDDWVVRVEAEAFESKKDVQMKENAQASGGKVLLFDKSTSTAEGVVVVKPGTYRVVPVGMSPDGNDHDALDLTVKALDKETGAIDLQQRICFDKEWDKFVDASGSPQIVVAKEGKLKVSLRVDDETGALLDRVEIRVHVPK